MPNCFHCGLPTAAEPIMHRLGGEARAFCCSGCAAASEMIWNLGLQAYYRFRTETPGAVTSGNGRFTRFDDPEVRSKLVRHEGANETVCLDIQGLNCAACGWLIDRTLQSVEGIVRTSVNSATGRARVTFDPGKARLSTLLSAVAAVGYRPAPVAPGAGLSDPDEYLRGQLKRLAVAGFGMMQVMMFAVALYTGAAQGMDGVMQTYMRYVSLVVATPVMWYAGWPFHAGALRALRARSVTMDVPVSLGLILAYGASVIDTVRHGGEVYFDSVTMFIFFLTLARFIELVARRRCVGITESLSRLLPALAHRIGTEGVVEDVPVAALEPGQTILVRNGEVVPADATLAKGIATLDESMLTGEATPVVRGPGERMLAGSLNSGEPVEGTVLAAGAGTVLSSIVDLLLRAQSERPAAAREADRMAARFLVGVLACAAFVFVIWHHLDPSRAFNATLAVLVSACPCAFSLGPLIALASATGALASRGILVANADAIESLAKATTVIFDKTGTLTEGRLKIVAVRTAAPADARRCLELAALLEAGSDHPIARAFAPHAPAGRSARHVKVWPGAGVEGDIEGRRYRLGTRAFALGSAPETTLDMLGDTAIVLALNQHRLASFEMSDALRPEAPGVVRQLQDDGFRCEMLSGDALDRSMRVARACAIPTYTARATPQSKLERVRALAGSGEIVAMIGDGINDAPVLGGAAVSLAMGRGSALAHASADLVLVRDSLAPIPFAFEHARRAARIMRQNLIWAAAYNFLSIPLAAMGWIPPWVAALGMSASSILVVLNSQRLSGRSPRSTLEADPSLALPQVAT